jgi:hypothetical protein
MRSRVPASYQMVKWINKYNGKIAAVHKLYATLAFTGVGLWTFGVQRGDGCYNLKGICFVVHFTTLSVSRILSNDWWIMDWWGYGRKWLHNESNIPEIDMREWEKTRNRSLDCRDSKRAPREHISRAFRYTKFNGVKGRNHQKTWIHIPE